MWLKTQSEPVDTDVDVERPDEAKALQKSKRLKLEPAKDTKQFNAGPTPAASPRESWALGGNKDAEMQRFVNGVTQIMVATTVIEVGVNVPNASVMVIESAERFGLSQLHQLRGRVGRGANQSFCVLMSGKELGKEARRRLETMCRTQDGFEIAEVDLELRGPGDLMGTKQSGVLDLKVADLVKDRALLEDARDIARRILREDAELKAPQHALLKTGVERLRAARPDWSRIS